MNLKFVTKYLCFSIWFASINLAFGKQILLQIPADKKLIIQFTPGIKAEDFILSWNKNLPSKSGKELLQYQKTLSERLNIHLLSFPFKDWETSEIIARLGADPAVVHVQSDHAVQFRTLPDDSWIGRQWPIEKIEADRVWDLSTGGLSSQGDTIVIAILDQGFDVDHEDLFENIWTNSSETPFDGIDNDGNGYIDDDKGWNFVGDGPDFSANSHGTSVAGLIGAKGNNTTGIAGINWNIKLMLFQISEVSHIISAYEYIVQQRQQYNDSNGAKGAYVVATNASFGADDIFCDREPLWGAMYDELGTVGILTGAGASNRGNNIDQSGDIPATCSSPYLINVLNTNEGDSKEPNSSYSTTYIDMAAPGEDSYTTKPFDRYGLFGDNSAAAPHITGAIGLMYALACPDLIEASKRRPSQTALLIKDLLLQGVDIIPGLDQYTLTGGRLNVWNAAQLLPASCEQETEAELAWEAIYPNPAYDMVYVDFLLTANSEFSMQIFNSLGQLVWENRATSNISSIVNREWVDVASWPGGSYFVRLRASGKSIETVLIKL